MQWVLNAIIRYKNFLLFLFLFNLGLYISGTQSSYHNSQIAKSSLVISGFIHQPFRQLNSYFDLADENKRLVEENNALKNRELVRSYQTGILPRRNRNSGSSQYWSKSAKIIRNSFTQSRNILLIDKGSNDSIDREMGVIGPKGIIGIVNQTSGNYASVLSILYRDLKINAKFKKSNVFGSLFWQGDNPNEMQLSDIASINVVEIGDTLVTGGMSSYFPEGIPIGQVKSFELLENGGYYDISVSLFNNMTDLEYVYVIGNKDRGEIIELLEREP